MKLSAPLALAVVAACLAIHPARGAAETARGVVYEDANRNEVRDAGEKGIPGVHVSNGRTLVATDGDGAWSIEVDDDDIVFVVKPSGWMTPVNEVRLPRFFYVHKPAGSPKLKFGGVAPTGPLPASIDFPLHRHEEPEIFRTIFFGDTQPYSRTEVEHLTHDTIEELIGADAMFGVTLGDIVGDDLSLFEYLNAAVALIGVPWYNVLGNHDIDYDAPDDVASDDTFERVYGPSYYSFNYGKAHFLVLDDVDWNGKKYNGGLGPQQLEFVKNDLALVPKDSLIVACMHIPLVSVGDREALFEILKDFPYTFSISAHWHNQKHHFMDGDEGWHGAEPHHHLVHVTAGGSWLRGAKDELGIPHATMSDGAPNGYSFITFDGNKYSIEFKASRRPADYQMNIYAPETIAAADAPGTEVLVNVFAGSERSKVRMRLAGGDWIEMTPKEIEDPAYMKLKEAEPELPKRFGKELPDPIKSPHIWSAKLPTTDARGTVLIEVETTDMFGKTHGGRRGIRIE